MSKLVVRVSQIESIRPHPNADLLELATIRGWQTVVPKGVYQPGDKVVFFPPDTILPREVSDRLGVTKYLADGRVRRIRLRGEISFGLPVVPDDPSWPVGHDVAEHYGATKYEPPTLDHAHEGIEPDHPFFIKYPDVEDMRNFPHIIQPGELVWYAEKIHGVNCRIGVVEGQWLAGSRENQRVRPPEDQMASNYYWYPYTLASVRQLIQHFLDQGHHSVVLFGETYGMQQLKYGLKDRIHFAAFDLNVDGHFLSYDEFLAVCEAFSVPTVPVLAKGPFSLEEARYHSRGITEVMGSHSHIREGVVIRPVEERTHPEIGRVVLKYLNEDYLTSKWMEFDIRDI